MKSVSLIRGGQIATFRFFAHIADISEYQYLNAQRSKFTAHGYNFFMEGVAEPVNREHFTEEELRIADYLRFVTTDSYRSMAKRSGAASQKKALDCRGAIRLDAGFKEIAQELIARGFSVPKWFVFLIRQNFFRKLYEPRHKLIGAYYRDSNPAVTPRPDLKTLPLMTRFATWIELRAVLRKAVARDAWHYCLVDFRDASAVQKLDRFFAQDPYAKALIFFGLDHEPGLIKGMQELGWEII